MNIKNHPDGPPTLSLELSEPQARLLRELTAQGIYGHSEEEVVLRVLDRKLQAFVDRPRLELVDISTNKGPRYR